MAPPRGNENSGGAFFMRNVNMFKRGRWQRGAHDKCFKHARLQCEQVMPLIWVGASQLVDLSGAHVKWPPPFFCKQTATYMFPKVYNFQIQQKRGIHNAPFCLHPRPRRGCPHGALASFCHLQEVDYFLAFTLEKSCRLSAIWGFRPRGRYNAIRSNMLFSCRNDRNNDQHMPVALVNRT
jgi:hypothetical protein